MFEFKIKNKKREDIPLPVFVIAVSVVLSVALIILYTEFIPTHGNSRAAIVVCILSPEYYCSGFSLYCTATTPMNSLPHVAVGSTLYPGVVSPGVL